MGPALFYCACALAECVLVGFCVALPQKRCLGYSTLACTRTYSIEQSNIDIWLQTLCRTALFCTCLFLTRFLPRLKRVKASLKAVLDLTSAVCQALLLSKAIIVALKGPEDLLPRAREVYAEGTVGLLYIFGALSSSATGLGLQTWLAKRYLSDWKLDNEQQSDPESGDSRDGQAPGKLHSDNAHTVKMLLRYSRRDFWLLLSAFSAGSIAALGQALIPYLTGRIIDFASIEPAKQKFLETTLLLVAVSLLCAASTGLRGGLFTLAMTRLNVRIRENLFAALLRQELGFFDTSKTGDIISRLSSDTTTVSDQICLNINVVVRSFTQAAIVFIFMLGASWRLTVVTVILLPTTILVSRKYGDYFRLLAKQVQTELAEANSIAEEVLASMMTVKAHAAEQSAQAMYSARLKNFYTQMVKEAVAYGLYMATNTFLPNLVNAMVIFYGGSLVLVNRMSAGALVSFMLYQQSLASAFQSLGDVFSSLMAALGAADKVIELISRQPRMPCSSHYQPASLQGFLSMDNVTFAYPARPEITVLKGMTFHVDAGKTIALVGPSGSGKSSIVKLIQRFYVPKRGRILLDNTDIGLYDNKWLKRRLALVSQDPVLYARSIKQNICFGLEEENGILKEDWPSDKEVHEAARHANAHEFIMAMPHGYDSDVGDKGVQLSGGQKQRLAIARALIRRPAVLLLDEATSSLDSDSEAYVKEALERLMQSRTTIVIAHRLSTIQKSDRILVISKGTIVEDGKHEQLLQSKGLYALLVQRQLTM